MASYNYNQSLLILLYIVVRVMFGFATLSYRDNLIGTIIIIASIIICIIVILQHPRYLFIALILDLI